MRVHPSQLTEGCILLEDVLGKSGRPIMRAKTELTEEHITILQKFLIESVQVSSKLADGMNYSPAEVVQQEKTKPVEKEIYLEPDETRSFLAHYMQSVKEYKQIYSDWDNGIPIDISKVRKSIIPLLERIEELDLEIFTLYQYSTPLDYFYHHSVAVSLLSAFLGKKSGYRKGEWIQLGIAGYLSNAGMTRIDSALLKQEDPLTRKQLQDIKNHATYSYRMVENLTGLSKTSKLAILQHHERMDGSGYPLGLTREKIIMDAKIIGVCDTYHAMTSERLYKKRQSIFKTLDEILHEQYTKFDPAVVNQFILSFTKRIIGKTARLTNQQTGEIIYIDDDHPTRPIIKLHGSEEMVSLQMNPDLHIEEIILD